MRSTPYPGLRIREALVYHRVPPYLRRIIGAFLTGRNIYYPRRYKEHFRGIEYSRTRIGTWAALVELRLQQGAAGRPAPKPRRRLLSRRHADHGPGAGMGQGISPGYGRGDAVRPEDQGDGTAGDSR